MNPIHTKLGHELCPEDQSYVLRAYVHRYTREHRPGWAQKADGSFFPVQFASDAEWLRNTRFKVRTDGRLDARVRSCESAPTWPDNPELLGRVAPDVEAPNPTPKDQPAALSEPLF